MPPRRRATTREDKAKQQPPTPSPTAIEKHPQTPTETDEPAMPNLTPLLLDNLTVILVIVLLVASVSVTIYLATVTFGSLLVSPSPSDVVAAKSQSHQETLNSHIHAGAENDIDDGRALPRWLATICRAHARLSILAPRVAPYLAKTPFEALGLDPGLPGVFFPVDVNADANSPGGIAAREAVLAAYREQASAGLLCTAPTATGGGDNGDDTDDHGDAWDSISSRGPSSSSQDETSAFPALSGGDCEQDYTASADLDNAVLLTARALLDPEVRVEYLRRMHPAMERAREKAEQEQQEASISAAAAAAAAAASQQGDRAGDGAATGGRRWWPGGGSSKAAGPAGSGDGRESESRRRRERQAVERQSAVRAAGRIAMLKVLDDACAGVPLEQL